MDPGSASASRPPPPSVAPIEHKGVRYMQDLDGPSQRRDQPTGYLLAVDPATNKIAWELKVYEVKIKQGLETDVQEIYFGSMRLVPGRDELLIENEVGGRYIVDLTTRSVRPAP